MGFYAACELILFAPLGMCLAEFEKGSTFHTTFKIFIEPHVPNHCLISLSQSYGATMVPYYNYI